MSRVMSAAAVAAVLMAGNAYAQVTPAPAPGAPAPYNEQFFLGVSAGGLMNTTLVTGEATATVYNQPAALAERRDVSGGVLFDAMGGMPVRGRFAAGASVSMRSATSDSAISASIPHPLFLGAPRSVSTSTTGMTSRQTWIGALAIYTMPGSDRVIVRVFGGPAVAMVSHDIVASFTVSETSSVAQPTLTVTKDSVSKSFWGAIGGADVSYRVSPSVAVGAFVRYAGAQANVTGAESGTLGGLESGAGVRFSFARK